MSRAHGGCHLSQAGRSADALLGSPTGVFVGCIWLEYGELLAAAGNPAGAYMVTGGTGCAAVGDRRKCE